MHRQLWAPSVALALLTTALVAPVLADDAELFTLESDTVAGGDSIKINFKGPLDPANQKYWVCVVEKGKADESVTMPVGKTSIRYWKELEKKKSGGK